MKIAGIGTISKDKAMEILAREGRTERRTYTGTAWKAHR